MGNPPETPSDTVRLRTGAEMPVLGLGTWQLTDDTADTVAAAIDMGYRLIDTSGDYGTEPDIAEALRRTDLDPDDRYLVTKVERHEDAYESAQQRLRQLDVDQVELLLIHHPPSSGAGVELWRGLQRARDDGLTVDIGVSNYSIGQMEELADATGEVPAVNQIEWSPFGWSREMLDHCADREIVIQAYSPLTRTDRFDDEVLAAISREHDKSPAQVLIRWNLQLGVVPLPKANQLHHLRENLDVFDFELTGEEMERLAQRNEHYSSLGGSLAYA